MGGDRTQTVRIYATIVTCLCWTDIWDWVVLRSPILSLPSRANPGTTIIQTSLSFSDSNRRFEHDNRGSSQCGAIEIWIGEEEELGTGYDPQMMKLIFDRIDIANRLIRFQNCDDRGSLHLGG